MSACHGPGPMLGTASVKCCLGFAAVTKITLESRELSITKAYFSLLLFVGGR